MRVVTCKCEQTFIALANETACPECVEKREALTCDECGTRLLEPADRCGLCTPSVYSLALAVMALDLAA